MSELTYSQLLSQYIFEKNIPYYALLNCYEWRKFRLEIIERDDYKCCQCNKYGTVSKYQGGITASHFYVEEVEHENLYDEDDNYLTSYSYTVLIPAPESVVLHVHHTYYLFDKQPWDYPYDSLVTICSECHFELHKKTRIRWFDSENNSKYLTPCPRCSGAGILPEYLHVQNGTCFYCKGNMYVELMK